VKGLKDVTDDWRWQRLFGQVAVLVLKGTYLALVDNDAGSCMDNLVGILLGAVVAASIWSAASAAVKAFRALGLMLLTSTVGERLGISRMKSICVSPPLNANVLFPGFLLISPCVTKLRGPVLSFPDLTDIFFSVWDREGFHL
jgi:hypothetical protein